MLYSLMAQITPAANMRRLCAFLIGVDFAEKTHTRRNYMLIFHLHL